MLVYGYIFISSPVTLYVPAGKYNVLRASAVASDVTRFCIALLIAAVSSVVPLPTAPKSLTDAMSSNFC